MKIYCIENKTDGKKYIGLTKGDINRRFKRHKELAKSDRKKQHLHKAMIKYGFDSFFVYQIDTASTFIELCEKEKYWIKQLNTKKNGYNETDGGEGSVGRILSEETKNKISNSNKGRVQSEDEKLQRSISQKGKRIGIENPFWGKKHTNETIQKFLSKKSKCVYCNIETTNANIKRWHNDNCKLK